MNARPVAAILAGLAAACASEAPPPGSGPDFDPPRVVERVPARGAVVPGLSDPASVRFDEPLADPVGATRGVEGSPAFDYRVDASRTRITIIPRAGWRDGVVYMLTIPAGLRDLLGNRTQTPIELQFSTGPPITRSRIEGVVYDRMTLKPARSVRLLFLPPDSVPYTALSDTAGAFRLPSIPPDEYVVFAFADRNRNRTIDRAFEPHDSATVVVAESTSIGRATLWLVEPDSTPPSLVEAVVVDSLRVRLQFDDAIEPDVFPGAAGVLISDTVGGRTWGVEAMYVGAPPRPDPLPVPDDAGEDVDEAAEPAAPPDSLAAPPDSLAAPPDGAEEAPRDSERGLPSTAVVVDLAEPLTAGTIRITASGFANLRGLVGGGAVDAEYVPPEPEPERDPEAGPEEAEPDEGAPEGDSEGDGEGSR